VQALENEPGYVVVSADRSWGRWDFRGLKDPVAREPGTVLAGAGFKARSLTGQWESYLSLDSAIVVERARRSLGVPPSVVVQLRQDTLALGGRASADWLAGVSEASVPAGVSVIESAGVVAELPAALDSLRAGIETSRILFSPGSAELSDDAEAELRAVARSFGELSDGVTAIRGNVSLSLAGRTDPSGSDETNQSLAQWRIDRVAARLVALGVQRALITGNALATRQPLPAPDPDARGRINRSVSISVTFATARTSSTPQRGSR
jgi:outer membrane protein OmpA-like peptidoglycan-associated protein